MWRQKTTTRKQLEQVASPLISKQVPVLHSAHHSQDTCMSNYKHYMPHLWVSYLAPIDTGVWGHYFQVTYISSNQSPPTSTAIVILQYNDNDSRNVDELDCPQSQRKQQ